MPTSSEASGLIRLSTPRAEQLVRARAVITATASVEVIVVLVTILSLIVRWATRPILRLSATTSRLPERDVTVESSSRERGDEVSHMAALRGR